MPFKGSFSHTINPSEFIAPLDLNTYAQGLKYKEGIAKENFQKIGSNLDNFANIPAFGVDAEHLQKKIAGFKENLAQMNLSNLSDFNTISQVNRLVNQIKSDPEVSAIFQRGSFYENELKKKKEAEEKGKQYVSPGLRQAEKYYNQPNFLLDERFNKTGFIAPDSKDLDDIAKNTPEWENVVTKGGYDVKQKGKAENALFNNYLTHFKTNPQWSQLLNDQFEQDTEGVNLDDIHNQGIEGIKQLFPYLPSEAQQQALNDINEGYQLQQSNPYAKGAWKDKLRDDFFKNQAYMAAQAKTYVNTVDKKANEFAKSANDFQEARALKLYEHELDQQYPKDEANTFSLVQGLEDFKQHKTGIPGLLNTEIFQKEVPDKRESVTYEYDTEGNKTPKSTTVSESKKTIKPKAVGYRDSDDTFTIKYDDGSVDQLTTQQIIDKVATAKPALAKNLKNNETTPTINTIEEYNNLPKGTKYKDSQGNIATKK